MNIIKGGTGSIVDYQNFDDHSSTGAETLAKAILTFITLVVNNDSGTSFYN